MLRFVFTDFKVHSFVYIYHWGNETMIGIVTFPFTCSLSWFHCGKVSVYHQIFPECTGLENLKQFLASYCAKTLKESEKKGSTRKMKRYSSVTRRGGQDV